MHRTCLKSGKTARNMHSWADSLCQHLQATSLIGASAQSYCSTVCDLFGEEAVAVKSARPCASPRDHEHNCLSSFFRLSDRAAFSMLRKLFMQAPRTRALIAPWSCVSWRLSACCSKDCFCQSPIERTRRARAYA